MRKALGKRCVWGVCGVLAAVVMTASGARADVLTDRSGSVLVWPKIVWNGTRDTIVEMANTRNESMVHVRCFYVNAALARPDQPPGPRNPRIWQVTDFELWLTKQQPTHWVVSAGRPVDLSDYLGEQNAGLDPGAIPPVPFGFEGELKCIQTEANGVPFGGNALKGEAVLQNYDADVTKYNAYAFIATNLGDGDNQLRLTNTPTFAGEYNSCPQTLLLNDYAEDTLNPQCRDEQCAVATRINTDLTLVPCNQDFEELIPGQSNIFFEITNELEQRLSGSTTVACWFDLPLDEFGSTTGNGPFTILGPGPLYTRIFPTSALLPDGSVNSGVIGIAEETHYFAGADGIILPPGFITPGRSAAAFNIQQEGFRFDTTRQETGSEDIFDSITLSDQQ